MSDLAAGDAHDLIEAFSAAAAGGDQDRADLIIEAMDRWTGTDQDRVIALITGVNQAIDDVQADPELVIVLSSWFSDAFAALGLPAITADLAIRCADQLMDLDQLDDAERLLRQARDVVADDTGDYGGLASHLLAVCLARQERHEEAAGLFAEAGEQSLRAGYLPAAGESFVEQARQIADDTADPEPAQRAADALLRAIAAYRAGDDHEAADEAEEIAAGQLVKVAEAAVLARRDTDAIIAAEAVITLAGAVPERLEYAVLGRLLLARARSQQDPAAGIALMRQSLDDARRLTGNPGLLGLAEFWLANLLGTAHALAAEIEGLLRSAHHHLTQAGDAESAAACLFVLGTLAGTRNDHERAGPLLAAAAKLHPEVAKLARFNEASRLQQSGQGDQAMALLRDLIADGEAADDPGVLQAATGMLGFLEASQGNHAEAAGLLARSRSLLDPARPDDDISSAMLQVFEGMAEYVHGDPEHGRASLEAAQAHLQRTGSRSLAAIFAMVIVADDLLRRAEPRAAIDRAVPAMLELQSFRLAFPSSTERGRWTAYLARLSHLAFQAAAAAGDPRLMAELIVTVQSQSIPEPVDPGDVAKRALDRLIESATATDDVPLPPETELRAAPLVQMPWGRIALQDHLSGPGEPGWSRPLTAGAGSAVVLHVPR